VTAIGTSVTVVGLVAAAPVVIGAGIAAAGALIPSVNKCLEERASVKTSDLYFLWDAQRQFEH